MQENWFQYAQIAFDAYAAILLWKTWREVVKLKVWNAKFKQRFARQQPPTHLLQALYEAQQELGRYKHLAINEEKLREARADFEASERGFGDRSGKGRYGRDTHEEEPGKERL